MKIISKSSAIWIWQPLLNVLINGTSFFMYYEFLKTVPSVGRLADSPHNSDYLVRTCSPHPNSLMRTSDNRDVK